MTTWVFAAPATKQATAAQMNAANGQHSAELCNERDLIVGTCTHTSSGALAAAVCVRGRGRIGGYRSTRSHVCSRLFSEAMEKVLETVHAEVNLENCSRSVAPATPRPVFPPLSWQWSPSSITFTSCAKCISNEQRIIANSAADTTPASSMHNIEIRRAPFLNASISRFNAVFALATSLARGNIASVTNAPSVSGCSLGLNF